MESADATQAVAPNPPPDAPDWQAQVDEIHCPMCDYNLRGLSEPRCPECGYRFEWTELIEAKARLHPYLFEHHPESNILSFMKTAIHGWMPATFWKKLHAGHPPVLGRLFGYWMMSISFVLVAFLLAWSQTTINQSTANWATNTSRSEQNLVRMGSALACYLAWVFSTFFVLQIFRPSMRRANVPAVHSWRVILYCSDGVMGLAIISVAMGTIPRLVAAFIGSSGGAGVPFTRWMDLRSAIVRFQIFAILFIAAACFIARFMVACRFYLRLEQWFATVILTQIVVLLVFALGSVPFISSDSDAVEFWNAIVKWFR